MRNDLFNENLFILSYRFSGFFFDEDAVVVFPVCKTMTNKIIDQICFTYQFLCGFIGSNKVIAGEICDKHGKNENSFNDNQISSLLILSPHT